MKTVLRFNAALLVLLCCGTGLAGVRDPWVRTDRSVDCRSRDTILADIIKPGMTDEEKAVAIWKFMLDHTWHFCRPDDNTPLRVLNVYGYALCGTLSRVQNWLRAGVFPPSYVSGGGCQRYGSTLAERRRICKGWLVDSWKRLDAHQERLDSGNLGHTMGEVFYDGHWHFLDCHAGFYIYTADRSRIAGYFDLNSDPTLVSDPVRTSDPFMPYDEGMPLFYYRFSGSGGKGVPDPAAKPEGEPTAEPSMGVALRPGETYIRSWHPIPGAFKWSPSWAKQWSKEYIGSGPRHVPSGSKTWRRYANGRFIYGVPLHSPSCKEGISEPQNVAFGFQDKKSPALHPADPSQPMSFAIDVNSPYVLIKGKLAGKILIPRGGSASVSIVSEKKKKKSFVWQRDTPGRQQLDVAFDKELDYGYSYRVLVSIEGGGGVEALELETIVQLNPLTLPRLKAGNNTVTVTCQDATDLQQQTLLVTYTWQETEGEKTHTEKITQSPHSYSIDVGKLTTTDPRDPSYMRALKLEVPAP